jgi:hypothetical protein
MKKEIILFLLALNILNGFTQERDVFISIRAGYSYPVGSFSSNDLDDGSFARTGINAGVEGGWYFTPHIGIGGKTAINLHPLDLQELAIEKIAADPFLSDVRIRSEEFQSFINSTGFYFRWPLLKKFQVNTKILSGVMYAKTPYQIYKPEYFLAGPEYYEITSSTDYSYLFNIGAGIEYSALPYLGLKIEGEYHYSKLTFRFNTAEGIINDHKSVSYINLVFGIVIKI